MGKLFSHMTLPLGKAIRCVHANPVPLRERRKGGVAPLRRLERMSGGERQASAEGRDKSDAGGIEVRRPSAV